MKMSMVAFAFFVLFQTTCIQASEMLDGIKARGAKFGEVTVEETKEACYERCLAIEGCEFWTWYYPTANQKFARRCSMYGGEISVSINNVHAITGSISLSLDQLVNPEPVDPCAGINCLNGGTCYVGVCVCPERYSGDRCQIEPVNPEPVDPCAGINCLNGGTCVDGVCVFPEIYLGDRCQIEPDPIVKVVYSDGKVAQEWIDGTITASPGVDYYVRMEVLRNDLQSASEKVIDVTLNGKSIGGCNPDGGDYDCTFFDCPTPLNWKVTAPANGVIPVRMRYTGHSWDCDCDMNDWTCSKESTVPNRCPMTAVARFTLTKVVAQDTCESCFEYDTDYMGADIHQELSVTSAADCQTLCQEHGECVYFTWVSALFTRNENINGKCHLKNGQGTVMHGPDATDGSYGLISGPVECCFEYDTDYMGADIEQVLSVPSAAACQTLCQEHGECVYFTWVSACFTRNENINGKCHLKNRQGTVMHGPDATDGSYGLISGPVDCCFAYDTDYMGADIEQVLSVASAADCQILCQGNGECVYFTWVSARFTRNENINGKCHLKNGQGTVMHSPEATDGSEGLVSGPAQC